MDYRELWIAFKENKPVYLGNIKCHITKIEETHKMIAIVAGLSFEDVGKHLTLTPKGE